MAKIIKPSKRWIGKILTATQDMTVPVLSGFDDATVEILDGQRVKVVRIQDDGWLVCRILDDIVFHGQDRQKVHTKDLLVGIHPEHDLAKFTTPRGKVREQVDSTEVPDDFGSTVALQMAADKLVANYSEDGLEALVRARRQHLQQTQDREMGDFFVSRQRTLLRIAELALQLKQGEVETPSSGELDKQWGFERLKEARQLGVTKDVVEIARNWIRVKRDINELNIELSKLTSSSKELEAQLVGVVRELEEQKMRVDNVIIALQRKKKGGSRKRYNAALEALEAVSADMAAKVRKFREETREYSEWLQLEQSKLVQAFSWASGFAKRMKRWLGRLDRKITSLEQMVFYSEDV